MSHILRDAPIGQFIRLITRNRVLRYPEEKPDFEFPEPWLQMLKADSTDFIFAPPKYRTDHLTSGSETAISTTSGANDLEEIELETRNPTTNRPRSPADTIPEVEQRYELGRRREQEKRLSLPIVPQTTKDGAILVDWYYTDDPENPQNWSKLRQHMVTSIICLYTAVIYTSSAIYITSNEGIMKEFGVNAEQASLGLALYVLGYGIGPMIFSPLSELPIIGRNPIYLWTMLIFVAISIPAAMPTNYAGLMVLRFLQGFFGSPCLGNGGATLGDMYDIMTLPYAMIAYVGAAYCGPALGPLLSGFSVPVMGWRWSLLEILWAAAPMLVVMFLFLPETSADNLLLRRAQRLRKITGISRFMSQSEIDQANLDKKAVFWEALIKPIEITFKDPAIFFVQMYTSVIYGIYYSFFEVFPLVYPVYYGMDYGHVGLIFLCVLVAFVIGATVYSAYMYFYMNPRIARLDFPTNETRLVPALAAAFGPCVGLFIFAWTARPDIHWIVPTIGITTYSSTVFVVTQCIFVYLPLSYPRYAASLFASNDFFRSAFAFASVLYAQPLFNSLGVARGTSLLGGLSTIGVIGIWALYFFGGRLRSMSKFATS
ncbi:major facilitator superfamily transporter [Hypomontagnella submonticulosa]|nr:major facilitator superfamily transporter [Hypomontagnella submonticulosa]